MDRGSTRALFLSVSTALGLTCFGACASKIPVIKIDVPDPSTARRETASLPVEIRGLRVLLLPIEVNGKALEAQDPSSRQVAGSMHAAARDALARSGFVVESEMVDDIDLAAKISMDIRWARFDTTQLYAATVAMSVERNGWLVEEVHVACNNCARKRPYPDDFSGLAASVLAERLSTSPQLLALAKGRTNRGPPAKSDAREGGPPSSSVAVFDLRDPASRIRGELLEELGRYLGSLLGQTARYRVVPADRVRAELLRTPDGRPCTEAACWVAIGRAVHAEKSLSTDVLQVGDRCALSSTLYDVASGAPERSSTVRAPDCSDGALMDGIERIVREIAVTSTSAISADRRP